MVTNNAWHRTIDSLTGNLNRSFGYTNSFDRADAVHSAIYRLLTLQKANSMNLNEDDLSRWLKCVATRMLIDFKRAKKHTTSFCDLYVQSDTLNQSEFEPIDAYNVRSSDIGLDIHSALSNLTPSLRSCFELHTQGFSAEEISAMLSIGREAVHKRIQRARKELRSNLKDYL